MPKFNTKKFVEAQRAKGRSDEEISAFLESKGIDPNKEKHEIKKSDNFFKSLAKGILKPAATLLARPVQLGKALGGATEEEQAIDLPFLGRIDAPTQKTDIAKDIGRGLETVSLGLGGGLAKKGIQRLSKGGLRSFAKASAKEGAKIGAVAGTGQAIAEKGTETSIRDLVTGAGVGTGIGTIAGGALPFLGAGARKIPQVVKGTSRLGGKAVKGAGEFVGETVLGTKGLTATKAGFKSPALQKKILRGEVTTETIAQKVGGFARKAQQASKAKLTQARKKITGTTKKSEVSGRIRSIFKKGREERLLLPEEDFVVDKLEKLLKKEIKGSGNIHKGDIDTIIRAIDDAGFFKKGAVADKFRNSNIIVNDIRKFLREVTKEGNPKFTALLEKASKVDIPFFQKLGKNIVGKDGQLNVDLLQNKINQLVKAVDDPNTRQESLKLLKELANRVGAKGDFINELEVFARSRALTGDIQGLGGGLRTLQQRAIGGAAKVARGAGRAKGKALELSKLFPFLK